MERILIPKFLVCKKDREVFNNIDLFRSLVGQIADFTRGGNTSKNEVMKTLSYLKFAKGLPALNEIFAFVKAFVFDIYKNEESSDNNASGLNSASRDTESKVLNKTAFKDLDRQRCLLEVSIKRHMDHIKELQDLHRKGLMFAEKQKQCQVKLQKKLDQPDGEKKKGTEKKIISLQEKVSKNGELMELTCLSYQTVLEKEKDTRREMLQLSEALQQQIVARTRDKLTESFDLLEEMAWSSAGLYYSVLGPFPTYALRVQENPSLVQYILEKVRAIDCQYASEQLYKHICKAYVFPDPEEWNIRTGFHAELEDPALLSSDYRRNKGECIGLVDVEEPDTDLENRPEEIYVKAVTNCSKGTDSSLTFKRGKVFKQKLVSRDGTIGFGWKRSSITGMKVWGFYHVCMVKFDHLPK